MNGRAALGISALPGSAPKICWYASSGHAPGRVAVADRLAVARRGTRARSGRGAASRARAAASRRSDRAGARGRRPRARRRRRRGRRRTERCVSPVGPARPRPATARRAAPSRSGRAARAPSGSDAAIAAGIVADVFTTSASPARSVPGQVGERRVRDLGRRRSTRAAARRRGPTAAHLGRLVRFERRRRAGSPSAERSASDGGHDTTSDDAVPRRSGWSDSISATRAGRDRRRAADDRRCPRRGTRPGASRCACRRDRPTSTRTSGCSAASTADSCSSAAFDDP